MKVVASLVAIFALALLDGSEQRAVSDESGTNYVNEVVVQIKGDEDVADLVAGTHGFRVVRQLPLNGNFFMFDHPDISHRSKRSSDNLILKLESDPNVQYVEQQRLLTREKRRIVHDKQLELPIRHYEDKSVYQRFYSYDDKNDEVVSKKYLSPRSLDVMHFQDPFWSDQWYLYNFGQTGGPAGYDVNVISVWTSGYTGKGVVVCILDDGIENTHPDLVDNYDPEASYDLNDKDPNPTPDIKNPDNSHGTRCAGEVAAMANNTVCGVGIAYGASIGGVRMLDGPITDSLEADALLFNNQHIHVYSSSWGPTDNGKSMEGPGKLCKDAMRQGALEGRNGLGSIFMWATGNGGMNGDSCSCDGYVSSIYTVAIGSITDTGLSTYFSEICPATLAVIFTGGSHVQPGEKDYRSPKLKVTTTDVNGGCTLEFQGTSSAAPLAAGCVALTLEANPNLTWRDVQYIVVHTARVPNAASEDNSWTQNGAGFHVNPRFGFGALDCGRMVETAQNWTTVGPHHTCTLKTDHAEANIPKGDVLTRKRKYGGCDDDDEKIDYLEHVEVYISLDHPRRGDVNMFLISPSGTRSEILRVRTKDRSSEGIDFTFMTVHNWGENPEGTWTLEIHDRSNDRYDHDSRSSDRGVLHEWSLTFYGTCCSSSSTSADKSDRNQHGASSTVDGDGVAHSMDIVDLKHTMVEEEQQSNHLQIKSDLAAEEYMINTIKSLKEVVRGLSDKEVADILTELSSEKTKIQHHRNLDRTYEKSYKSFYPEFLNSVKKKSDIDAYENKERSYDQAYHQKILEKRKLENDVDTNELREMVSLIEEFLNEK